MSSSILRHLMPLAGAAVLSIAAALPAQASEDAGYRCHVVGDSKACESLPAPTTGDTVTQVVPGDYAHYLMYLGESTDKAIAEARARGEQPTVRIVRREQPRQLSSTAAYQQYLGL